jgi:hypothetical protein
MTQLEAEFERCWQWLEAALKRGGPTHEKHHVRDLVLAGKVQLWPCPNAALITEIAVYPTGFKELRCWLVGGKMGDIKTAIPHIEAWAKTMGCSLVTYVGRKGWARALPDYRVTLVSGKKEL